MSIHLLKLIKKEQRWPTPTFDKQKPLMHKQTANTKKKEKNMQDDQDILHKTLMVEAEFVFGENEDKPHRTLMVKAQKKKNWRKIKTYLTKH